MGQTVRQFATNVLLPKEAQFSVFEDPTPLSTREREEGVDIRTAIFNNEVPLDLKRFGIACELMLREAIAVKVCIIAHE